MIQVHRTAALLTIFLPICLLIVGCSDKIRPVANAAGSPVTLLTSLPTPGAVDARSAARPAFIGPYDTLQVSVFGIAELDLQVQTDGQGDFAFPLAGTIQAAGKSTAQIAELIRARLDRRYVKRPEVTVNLVKSSSQAFAVDGEVTKPGQYPIVGEASLMRAIAAAGGLTDTAKLDDVLIFRRVDGKDYVGIYNIGAIRRGNYADPAIFSNDVVVVGDSPQRRRFKDILQAAPLLSTPLVILGQQL
jgi:polysaccharide biosynthesis/export protein